jgi:hypothetical protein
MLLFKYVSNLEYILNDGYIRATQLSALNDPFEANYDYKGLEQLTHEFDSFKVSEVINYIEENKHRIGVISFSESKDNLLMWAHYADNHKGGLIGFYFFENSIISDLFILKNFFGRSIFDGKCISVKYRKQPLYKIDTFDRDYSDIDAEGYDRLLYEIFQQKSDEWIYEKEHRIILKLEQAHRIIIDNEDIEKYGYKSVYWFNNLLTNNSIIENNFIEFIDNKLYVYLERLEDESDRITFGNLFSSLAKHNPNMIFLFKISTSSIHMIAHGHRDQNIKEYEIKDKYIYFKMLKAVIDKSNYTLGFKKKIETT